MTISHADQPSSTALHLDGAVLAVHRSARHTFSKPPQLSITLVAGIGVEGDAHSGTTVKHRSRVRANPDQPNLRQVHLIPTELHAYLRLSGFDIQPGEMGENITTQDINLLALPTDTKLYLGDEAVIQITGLRNPCVQLDNFRSGLMSAVLDRDDAGNLIRKAGVMAIVLTGGEVRTSDPIRVELPAGRHRPLRPV